MYRVVFKYLDGRKGIVHEYGKPAQYPTEQEAAAFASDLNERLAGADEEVKRLLPVYSVEPAPPQINVKGRIEVVRAMETIARAINHEGIFEEWLSCGVADGDIDDDTTDEELMYYVESNETFGELMSTFTHMMKKVHNNGGLYVDGVASDKYNGR